MKCQICVDVQKNSGILQNKRRNLHRLTKEMRSLFKMYVTLSIGVNQIKNVSQTSNCHIH